MMNSSVSQFFWVHSFFLIIYTFASLSDGFLPAENVTLSGDARFRNNTIILTQEHSCLPFSSSSSSSSPGIGRAFYIKPIRFLDLATNSTASFSSRFSLSITPTPFCPFGEGFTFLITSDSNSFSLSPGHMGLPDPPASSSQSFFAVEFDTNFNPNLGDINDNHLGIDVNTASSLTSVDVGSRGIILKSAREIHVWIEYRHDLKMVRVWLGYSHSRPENPLLAESIDLSKQFKEFMYVGFSASNGQGSALYIVDRWRFKTFGLIPSLVPIDTINGGDCFMCSSEESTTNKTHLIEPGKKRKKVEEMAIELCALAAFTCSIVTILGLISFVLIKKMRVTMRRKTCQAETNMVPTRLSLSEIKSATMGFNRSRVVGEGGSAIVYRGFLPSGGEVAVKRFERGGGNDRPCNPFTTEFATMVGCLRHKNLVQLYGWCCEGNELVLVYEYLPNGSLDKLLHESFNSPFVLPWKKRYSIVLGVASALTYLHEECESQIIHRDVKTCNIMLDAEFNAKLGDFGLAEVYEHHSSITRESTIPAGTMGYLAPEYVYSGVPTVKTDVYSFGVVALEVSSGRRPVNEDGSVLVDWIWELWEMGKLIEGADSRLMGRYNVVEMERMLMVGLYCVHPSHEKRPTMREAARILKGEAPLPVLPSRKPRVSIVPIFSDEEIVNSLSNCLSVDESGWMTPKSHFSQLN